MPQDHGSSGTVFEKGHLWLLVPELLRGVAAAIAGDWAEGAAEKAGIAESMIETHETLAFVTLGIFGALLLGRLVLRNRFTRKTLVPYFLIAAIGLGTLSATGHYGGDLVYEQGAGVAIAHHTPLNGANHARHNGGFTQDGTDAYSLSRR
jgi:uncharacterized membrane protein